MKRKPKAVLKAKNYDDSGMNYSADYIGDEGICLSMALNFAITLAKENDMSLTKFKSLTTDMWKELEEENGKN